MSDTEKFIFAKWPVEVHRRPFRRSVSIQLAAQKPIKVIASMSTSQKVITDFLLQKKTWIEKHLLKFEEQMAKNPVKKITAQENFPFLGTERSLKVVITFQKKSFISLTDTNLLLHIPRDEWSADTIWAEHPAALEHIRHFYKREAQKEILQRVRFWTEKMNLHPAQVRFKEQRTRWGSCSSKKIVNLNWRLIVFKPEIIDYVVVHELAHLKHMNHSADFWNLVELHIPNFKDAVAHLKSTQGQVDFLNKD